MRLTENPGIYLDKDVCFVYVAVISCTPPYSHKPCQQRIVRNIYSSDTDLALQMQHYSGIAAVCTGVSVFRCYFVTETSLVDIFPIFAQ